MKIRFSVLMKHDDITKTVHQYDPSVLTARFLQAVQLYLFETRKHEGIGWFHGHLHLLHQSRSVFYVVTHRKRLPDSPERR